MEQGLTSEELHPRGGTWSGLLFENPAAGYPLALTWTFTIDFDEVVRDDGSTSLSLTVGWVPAGTTAWSSMAGQRFTGTAFGDPIETSVYYFEHHRFDCVDLAIDRQSGAELQVTAEVGGDVDGLGLARVAASATLRFEGIYVQAAEVGADPQAATELLAQFSAVEGLRPVQRKHNVLLEPER